FSEIRRLNFCRGDATHHLSPNRRFPVFTSRHPLSLITKLLVNFQKTAAGITRMKLHNAELWLVMLHGLADTKFCSATFAWCFVITLTDHHVATITVAAVEVTSASRAFTNRCDHFKELIANREHRVLQP